MGLGPQCWTCRSRRVRCTSEEPSCQKCSDKGIVCSGYGPTKPVRWKQPTVNYTSSSSVASQTTAQSSSSTSNDLVRREMPELGNMPLPRSIELSPEKRVIVRSIEYYNHYIAPDLVPVDSPFNPNRFTNDLSWMGEARCMIFLQVCMTNYHQSWKRVQWSPQHRPTNVPDELLQPASALVRIPGCQDITLQQQALKIVHKDLAGLNARQCVGLLSNILSLIAFQLQRSAFSSWRVHLSGAQSLVTELGGLHNMEKTAGVTEWDKYHLTSLLIFAATTTPAHHIFGDEKYHQQVSAMFQNLDVDTSQTATPFPTILFAYISSVTQLRVRFKGNSDNYLSKQAVKLIEQIRRFNSRVWAEAVARRNPGVLPASKSNTEHIIQGYALLVETLKAATALYALRTLFLPPSDRWSAGVERSELDSSFSSRTSFHHADFTLQTYHDLCQTLHELFKRKLTGDTSWKFCIWPMVIAGQQAVHYQDEKEKEFLCWELHNMSRSLGAGAMQDGAYLISRMFHRQKQGIQKLGQKQSHNGRLTWDEIFEGSPLFMM
ncbi:uncharacterized protein RSE6_01338 [Rhynchosporium secalis]|uniref:Zn(2)-C6 fungal-type domain-containing protein n=1 Tax=Rhynchosporium secalis TaxID=38038 RepID=A0A1E1LXI7_RHYSE|nr:uncharacterized protein RSE6_01338 [Rhynchosporium secalis]